MASLEQAKKFWIKALAKSGPKPGRGDNGYSFVVVMFVALTLILASLASAQRSSNSLLGSFFNSDSKEARETAESGITEIIGILNQKDNRGLLVSGVSPSDWDQDNDPRLLNPCNTNAQPPADAAAAIGGTSTLQAAGEQNQRYYLKSIIYTSVGASGALSTRTYTRSSASSTSFASSSTTPSFDPADINLNGDKKGYLTIVVVGEILKPGTSTVLASTEVKREFQIVPKCCNRSFGSTYADPAAPSADHGKDQRACDVTSAFTPLVVGTDGTGTFTTKGNSYTLCVATNDCDEDDETGLKTIATLNNSEDCDPVTDCQFEWGDNVTLMKPANFELPALPATPTAVTKSGCLNTNATLPYSGLSSADAATWGSTSISSQGSCTTSTVQVDQTVYTYQKAATKTTKGKTTTYSCNPATLTLGSNLPSGAITVNSSGTTITRKSTDCYSLGSRKVSQSVPDPYCAFNTSTGRFNCLIRYMSGNINIKVDSTQAPVDIFMYDAAGVSPAGGSISFNGNGGIAHVKCGTTFSASCSTDASSSQFSRFSMYGNVDGQNIDLRGNTGALAGFFYFPYSNVDLSGGGGGLNFSGILWTNQIDLNGGIEFLFPSTGDIATNLCALYANLCDSNPTNDGIRPQYDYVARSVSSTSLFN
jgi:hypothetical protein